MDQPTTLFLLGLCTLIGGIAFWQSSRHRPFGTVALFPWTGLLFTAVVGLLVLTVHLLALVGLTVAQRPGF